MGESLDHPIFKFFSGAPAFLLSWVLNVLIVFFFVHTGARNDVTATL